MKVIGRNNKKKVNFSLADHERNRGGKPRLRGGGGCLNKEEKTNFHAFAALHDSLVPVCRCVLEKKFKTAAFTLLYFLVSWGSRFFFCFLDEFMTLAKPWGRFTREVPEKKKKKLSKQINHKKIKRNKKSNVPRRPQFPMLHIFFRRVIKEKIG